MPEGEPLNPLASIGHFLALDGFGAPSEQEQALGMPFHGEANAQLFRTVATNDAGPRRLVSMQATLPLAQETLMRTWRYQIIQLFRKVQSQLVIPPGIQKQLHHAFTFNQFLDLLYKKHWIVHCSKPSTDHKQNIHYLGRYVKRPAIAESKLKHYDGHEVTFKYLDHNTKTYRKFTLTVDQFIARFIQHIPDAGFRMIRYYGFLAHRVKGKLLPIVYQLLGQETPLPPAAPTYAELIQINFNFNPLVCLLCGQQMLLTAVRFGITKVCGLLLQHRALALLQKI